MPRDPLRDNGIAPTSSLPIYIQAADAESSPQSMDSILDLEGSYAHGCRGPSIHLYHVPSSVEPATAVNTALSIASSSNSAMAASEEEGLSSIFYSYPNTGGGPPGRWAHSACLVGSSILVFGGIGATFEG